MEPFHYMHQEAWETIEKPAGNPVHHACGSTVDAWKKGTIGNMMNTLELINEPITMICIHARAG